MPTATFYRLPEEKRTRLLEAAWEEFTRVPFAEASINRIIADARIPRGSFYQYFEDKEDLFNHLLDQIRDKLLALLDAVLQETKGDIFAMPVGLLDALIGEDGKIVGRFSREFSLLGLNVHLDVQQLFFERAASELCPKKLLERIDPNCLRRQDDLFVGGTFSVIVGALAMAIAHIWRNPQSHALERQMLAMRLDIIRGGAGRGDRT